MTSVSSFQVSETNFRDIGYQAWLATATPTQNDSTDPIGLGWRAWHPENLIGVTKLVFFLFFFSVIHSFIQANLRGSADA